MGSDVSTTLSQRLVCLRMRAGLTQEQLAERSGLHRNAISNLERGVGNQGTALDPRLSTILRLASALSVAPSTLIDNLNDSPQQRTL